MESKKSAREIAASYLLSQIKSGVLHPGDKIMNERSLAQQLGISRVPLREAIVSLSALGILESRQGNGTFVNRSRSATLAQIIMAYGLFEHALVDEVFEARILFEADAAKLAAVHRTPKDMQLLHDIMKKHGAAVDLYYAGTISVEEMLEYDGAVHLGIAAASHNHFIVQMVEAVRLVTLDKGLFRREYTLNTQHFRDSVESHQRIADAIGQGDAGAAYDLMQAHIRHVQAALDLDVFRRMEKD
ncbi:transcriptional regulator [Megasphaera cerevisiae DSM 20462]|jgi:GntR family transcriptional repressor for pyruvate dehydrogenase complex|uniref:Transcriptional regulator n=1 Tax=Megasphaera cerevisiae DSM 20462 TaxID=1122219 RepID=A0A0J6WRA5_9FIRM|nr:FadR/GntR family transcriptional regulator [Megasphaera cerevisiae]KMO85990.1 transcriptional regulator [Megasphaera cerevisiae DSM 20462]MCI1750625.1 FadR family transcriptional regulator [Megasphaera cerevisiae]OKY54412.1 transcriptional regulator [Megasphaera cerevisiae]SJZ73385.1 DNA-binding transcriptional regulator, FadR family [Megasphaera cerevisiae DSM 20462]